MDHKQIISKLKTILARADIGTDVLIRKRSSKHDSEIEMLLEHVALLVLDAKFDAEISRRELFEVRTLLETEET